jgi:hypothetical protein
MYFPLSNNQALMFKISLGVSVPQNPLSTFLDQSIIQLVRVVKETHTANKKKFIRFSPPFLEFFYQQLKASLRFDRFLILSMDIIKDIVFQSPEEYTIPQELMPFIAPEILGGLCQTLITQYFVYTPELLEQWKQEPELFRLEAEDDQTLRVCSTIKPLSLKVNSFKRTNFNSNQ